MSFALAVVSSRTPVQPSWPKCARLAGEGELQGLINAKDNGCPWDAETCKAAARGGHLEVLKFARGNGCPWNADTCTAAARGGHLEVLAWALKNGCPWDGDTTSNACWSGSLECLRYAVGGGCPWDPEECARSAEENGSAKVRMWLEREMRSQSEGPELASSRRRRLG